MSPDSVNAPMSDVTSQAKPWYLSVIDEEQMPRRHPLPWNRGGPAPRPDQHQKRLLPCKRDCLRGSESGTRTHNKHHVPGSEVHRSIHFHLGRGEAELYFGLVTPSSGSKSGGCKHGISNRCFLFFFQCI